MKIVVDCHGNDLGAKVAVEASVKVVNEHEDVKIVLVGVEEEIKHIYLERAKILRPDL